jgi:hypothetical protein
VEVVGGKKVMQYRGGNLLLFTIDQVASVKPIAEKEGICWPWSLHWREGKSAFWPPARWMPFMSTKKWMERH